MSETNTTPDTSSTEYPTLQEAKAGDPILYDNGGYHTPLQIKRITRVTPTQIFVGTSAFRRKDGGLVGGSGWNREGIRAIENDQEAQRVKAQWDLFVAQRKVKSMMTDFNFKFLTLDEAASIIRILEGAIQRNSKPQA